MARTKWSHLADIDPAEWEYLGSFDDQAPLFWITIEKVDGRLIKVMHEDRPTTKGRLVPFLRESEVSINRESGQCDHCGAHIRYVCVLKHTPSGDVIATGETCLSNRFDFVDRAHRDLKKLREEAAAERERVKLAGKLEDYVLHHPGVAQVVDWQTAHPGQNSFVDDCVAKLQIYGDWSDRQLDALTRAIEREDRRAEQMAERERAHAAGEIEPCPSGRVEITGTVVSIKEVEGYYPGETALKMTVRDDRGFRVWGSVPSSLYEYSNENGAHHASPDDRVTFHAAVEPSGDDPTFGFFKRPTRARFLREEVTT